MEKNFRVHNVLQRLHSPSKGHLFMLIFIFFLWMAVMLCWEHSCDTPKPKGSLTTRQLAEDSWISVTRHHTTVSPFPGPMILTKIGQSLLCMGISTQNTTFTKKPGNMAQYNTMTSLGQIMSESDLTGPTLQNIQD